MKKLFILATLIFTAVFSTVSAEQITFDSGDITFYNFYSDVWGYEFEKEITEFNQAEWNISIPFTSSIPLIFRDSGIYSTIYFYDTRGYIIHQIRFDDIYEQNGISVETDTQIYGNVTLDLTNSAYGFPQDEISEIVSFKFYLQTTNTTTPGGFIDFLEANTFITTGQLPIASFYHNGNLYHEEQFNGIIDGPSSNPSTVNGLPFDQWVDSNGTPWNPSQPYSSDKQFYSVGDNQVLIRYYVEGTPTDSENAVIDEPYQLTLPSDPTVSGKTFLWWEFEDGTIVNPNNAYVFTETTEIYARFTTVGSGADAPDNDPETIQGLSFILTTLGWDNTAGYILFLSLILIPLNLLFAYLRFPIFAIGIINLSILGLFVFLQFLPFWAMFILIGSVLMGLIAMARGVINLE